MKIPFSIFVGLRYLGAKNHNHFISFISLVSLLGIGLGVAVLITVLSVMNGFGREIRQKILLATPHLTVRSYQKVLYDWPTLLNELEQLPGITAAAPFVVGEGLAKSDYHTQGALMLGILPEQSAVYPFDKLFEARHLQPGRFYAVVGQNMARHLHVNVGDQVMVYTTETKITPAGVMPRFKRFTVAHIFASGTLYDDNHILLHLQDAATLFKMKTGITGIQLKIANPLEAPLLTQNLRQEFQSTYFISDWTRENESLFAALKMEKTVMWVILFLIVAIATFNLVATLVMIVTEKRSSIGLLRTIGATRAQIVQIFMIQGTVIGCCGTVLGLGLGILLSQNITFLVDMIQTFFQVQLIAPEIYHISHVPADIQGQDLAVICIVTLILSFLATLYPAWQASHIQPAEALRYE